MAPDIIKFTYQITYPPRVYILIYYYETYNLHKINLDSRVDYMREVADFIEHLKDISKGNDIEPRKTHIIDTLEGISQLNDYLLDLWKINLNTKGKTLPSKINSLTLA